MDENGDGASPWLHSYDRARVEAIHGRSMSAVHWLHRAREEGWWFQYTHLGRTDPLLASLKGFAPFEELMAHSEVLLDRQRERVLARDLVPDEVMFAEMLAQAKQDAAEPPTESAHKGAHWTKAADARPAVQRSSSLTNWCANQASLAETQKNGTEERSS